MLGERIASLKNDVDRCLATHAEFGAGGLAQKFERVPPDSNSG
jgi:hypothetical protein